MALRKDGGPHSGHMLLFICVLLIQLTTAGFCVSMPMTPHAFAIRGVVQPGALHQVNLEAFQVDNIQANSGEDVPVRINLPSEDEFAAMGGKDGIFILVQNIPKAITLSAGLASGNNLAVTLQQAETLRLKSNPGVEGSFQLDFILIGTQKRPIGRRRVTVSLSPPQVENEVSTTTSPQVDETAAVDAADDLKELTKIAPPPTASPESPAAPPLTEKEETVLLQRAREILQQGGIAGARIIYEELAGRGSRDAAFALAQTYDPAFIKNSPELGVTPDIELALKWYERASELGSAEAERRKTQIAIGQ